MEINMPNHLFDKYESIFKMYEKNYIFKLGDIEDYDLIINFINEYWKKDHILTKSKELFDWQHLDTVRHRYNFVLAVERSTQTIAGLIGFILSDIYDVKIQYPIRWGAIWKVREDIAPKGLGICLKYFLEKKVPAPYAAGIGLSEYSREINKKLGEDVGKLKLYYMLNEEKKTGFRLASGVTEKDYSFNTASSCKKINKISFQDLLDQEEEYYRFIPEYKTPLYYMNRYGRHPIYTYDVYEIADNHSAKACIILRQCRAEGACALTIVDYIGNGLELEGTYKQFQEILKKYDAEYISFYELGLFEEGIAKAGFKERCFSKIVIPLYFEPLVRENVDIDYHFISDRENCAKIILKGDADQDRPNRIIRDSEQKYE